MKHTMAVTSMLVGGVLLISQQAQAMDSRERQSLAASGPGWTLDINNKSRAVDFNAGDDSVSYKYPSQGPTVRDGGETIIYFVHPSGRQMNVQVRNKACTDTAGASHDKTVAVVLDGQGYWGCGSYK